MYLLLIIVILIIILAIFRRPMVSDGRGNLVPAKRLRQSLSVTNYESIESRGVPVATSANRPGVDMSGVHKVKAWMADYDKTGIQPSLAEWDTVSQEDKDLGGWSYCFDKNHPHPENDFFWDGV